MLFHRQRLGSLGKIVCAGILISLLTARGNAEDRNDFGDYPEEVRQYLQGLLANGQHKCAFRADYPGGLDAWQKQARPILHRLVGLNKISEQVGRHETGVELTQTDDLGEYTRQKWWIETEPHVRIKFWLLKPKQRGPFPLAIFPHGHDSRGYDTSAGVYHDKAHRDRTLDGDRDVAVQAVKRGFLAIAPATRGLADGGLPDPKDRHGNRGCRAQVMHCLLAGRTAIGERVWDLQRIIDWAATLEDVDATRVLMMGNSGGGVATFYAAACDERITVAVPSCSFTTYTSPNGYIYLCDCNIVPGILEFGETWDVAGLIAPRYLLAVNGRKDALHSAADVNRAASRTQAIYAAAAFPDRFAHRWGDQGHRFYKDLMWDFVADALRKSDSGPQEEAD
jgi:dienelactone hydrolase